MISPQLAAAYLADETRHCPVPMAPGRFEYRRDARHDFVFFGHRPVRAYKQSGRWKFHEPEVRAAGRAVAALPWDPDDLADPRPGGPSSQGGSLLEPAGWRAQIWRLAGSAARTAHEEHGCPCGTPWYGHAMTWGLRCGLTEEVLRRRYGQYSIACILPVASLVWRGDTWMIPRTLAFMLDRWEAADEALGRAPTSCRVCGTMVTGSGWGTAATGGGQTLCPGCARATLLSYGGQFQGRPYAKIRDSAPQAGGYLCVLCDPPRPAAAWDHCHDHGLVRGPLCVSCNTMEGHGKEFLTLKGSTAHLLRCTQCRTTRTLPANHRLAALRQHLHRERAADGRDCPLHMCVQIAEGSDGGYIYTVTCADRTQSLLLSAEEAARIQARAVEEGLSSGPGAAGGEQ
ncbi:endonuclease domain-containing protein [Streptomyces sp. NPDC056069]|uniref:endonuclease domain-containing protein n=1 Tax=Streptomyces sp. NPDC056069 TaxID=3345702 RepID=UPI0035E1667E